MTGELDSRGGPEDLFDGFFQEEKVVSISHGHELALSDAYESDEPPELEDLTGEETPRVKPEGGRTKCSK